MRAGAPCEEKPAVVIGADRYSDHAAETGMEPPAEPIMFRTSPNTRLGRTVTIRATWSPRVRLQALALALALAWA